MRSEFITGITTLMHQHDNIVFLTADLGFSVLENMQKTFGKRFMNTGVTEQSTVSMASGFAHSGFTVYIYAQAVFASMRCFEQVRLDLGYQHLDVKIIGVSPGFNLNQLGVSHSAIEDVALMRMIPGFTVLAPGDPYEAEWAAKESYKIKGPVYIRLSKGDGRNINTKKNSFRIGKGIKIEDGNDATIFVSGSMLSVAKDVVTDLHEKKIQASLISMPTIKPIDREIIIKEAKKTKNLFTIEEHSIIGGLGSAVAEVIAESTLITKFYRFGIQDQFTGVAGSPEFLLSKNGLTAKKIVTKITHFL